MQMTPAGAVPGGSTPQGPGPRLVAASVLAGRFTIDRFLSRLPLGELYYATDGNDGRAVWVQLLDAELLGGGARAQIDQDVGFACHLDHKNIAATSGIFNDGDRVFVVGEAIDGSTLGEMLDRKRAAGQSFTLKSAYSVATHICNALEYAHGALLHGLLSTDTVIVNGAGRVKLVDFGFGRGLAASERFRARLGPGAAACLAPEMVAQPLEADLRADLYSLGAILYLLLTGRAPGRVFERPSAIAAEVPAALDEVIERCLHATPAERFESAHEVKRAIHAAIEGGAKPAAAPAPPPSPAARKAPPPPAPPKAPMPTSRSGKVEAAGPRLSQPRVPTSFKVDSALAAVDDAHERWLIQKDKLDFGPFRLAEVRHQIEAGQILGEHTIVDMENGERRRVKDHALLRELVVAIESKREAGRVAEVAAAEARTHRRRTLSLLAIIAGVLLVGVPLTIFIGFKKGWFGQPKVIREVVHERDSDDVLKGIEITMKVDPPASKEKKHHGHGTPGAKNANGEFSDVTNLGDATSEGGDETLGQDVVQKVMAQNFSVLKGCVLEERHRDRSLQNVDMDFIIRGSGQVSAVKVNGKEGTPFQSCMLGKMQTIMFPKFNGTRTHASFSLKLK
jgi:serine/threonine-protein kinase